MHEFLSKSHTSLQAEWNPKMAARSVVVRERNERDFRNFLQNLKKVVRLFLTPGNGNLTTDAYVEVRHHMLDASQEFLVLTKHL